ncbi:hypothetical protein [Paenibacillus illinoisensis]|uniref:Uncharacterized protein n=1 Tax=Paenibacillus illinoisensis TaxID=59845 RepID=A0A2W0C8A9_9BACL|nr:hypothetical protein [Paenibacillus illinoisensis]PYY28277.1 hypothetical protein PIL02S_03423 [Paenibacillus illinoisensis]
MWILIDYQIDYIDSGCDVQDHEMFQVQNKKDGSTKWIDQYAYNKMLNLGLIASQ